MPELIILREPPANIAAYGREVATALITLYGASDEDLALRVQHALITNLSHPDIRVIAAVRRTELCGLVLGIVRREVAEVSFLHMLEPWRDHGLEHQLVQQMIDLLRDEQTPGIVSECLLMFETNLDPVYRQAGFTRIPRQMMACTLNSAAPPSGGSRVLEPGEWKEAAACLVDAYRAHPGRLLHAEVRDVEAALAFLERVAASHYGLVRPEYLRTVRCGQKIAGLLLGCELLPGIGFVIQVGVRPEFHRRGLGRALMEDVRYVFAQRGLSRVALGVTDTNPARLLYQKLGFEKRAPVTAYAWWREGIAP